MTGCSRATRPASRSSSNRSRALASAMLAGRRGARSSATRRCRTAGAPCRSSSSLAERYLDPRYAPEAVAETLRHPGRDHPADRRRDRADVAFEQAIELAGAVDRLGRPAARDDARPAGRDACDARHLGPFQRLPDLPRAAPAADAARHDRCAGRLPLQAALSEAGPAGPEAGRQAGAGRARQAAAPARRSAIRWRRRICSSTPTARPLRIDKAFSWDAPLAAHGMMHIVIRNAWHGDPYPIDTLFMYMANMAWNSAMNTAETMRMLTDKDPATGEYRIPHIIYSDAYYSETVAYADLVLPDTTYLERWDCISLLDRPIGDADGPADAIRQPVVAPDRDVRPFQDVLIELGARLGLPGFVDAGRRAALSRRLRRLHRQPRAHARRRPARRLARRRRRRAGRGRAQPAPARALHRQRLLLAARAAAGAALLQARQPRLSRTATAMGLIDSAEPIVLQLYGEPLQRFRLAAQGHGERAAAGDAPRAHRDLFRSAAVLVHAVRGGRGSTAAPFRCTRSPSGRCRCTIPGARRTPGCARSSAATGST